MSANDGGPAFPFETQGPTTAPEVYYGMTLRDWFAGKAPAQEIDSMVPATIGDCAKFIGMNTADYIAGEHFQRVLAKVRYQWADAMLAERAK